MDDPAPPLRRSSPGRALLVALLLVVGGAGVLSAGGWSPAEAEPGQPGSATEVVLVVAAVTALHAARWAPRPARRRAERQPAPTGGRRRWTRPLAVGPPAPARAPPRRAG